MTKVQNEFEPLVFRIWILFVICCLVLGYFLFKTQKYAEPLTGMRGDAIVTEISGMNGPMKNLEQSTKSNFYPTTID